MDSRYIPRRKSNTTLLAFAYDDWFMIGADSRITCPSYGRVLDDSCMKMFSICDGVFVCWSGNGDFQEELMQIVPEDLMAERSKPKNIEEAAGVMVNWVNYFSESNLVEVNLLVVGAVGEEKYKIFNIKPDPRKAKTERSWEHEMFLVDSKIIAIGTGSNCASLVLKKGKSVIGEMEMEIEEMEEKEAVDLAFDALKAAALKDWGTGGTLRVLYKTKTLSKEHVHLLVPKITEYCKSGYSSQLLVD